jgi:hypothetical protein
MAVGVPMLFGGLLLSLPNLAPDDESRHRAVRGGNEDFLLNHLDLLQSYDLMELSYLIEVSRRFVTRSVEFISARRTAVSSSVSSLPPKVGNGDLG